MSKARAAAANVEGDRVVVRDAEEAQRVHQRGHFGRPLAGGGLELHRIEAAHLIDAGRLRVEGMDHPADLLVDATGEVEVAALAYQDLRSRGLVVRPRDDGALDVWGRAQGPPSQPWFQAIPVSERAPVDAARLADFAGSVLSIVDEEGVVTHYQCEAVAPMGEHDWSHLPTVAGRVLADRVIVDGEGAERLAQVGLGTAFGQSRVLSFLDACWLQGLHLLEADEDVAAQAANRQDHFQRTWPVFKAMVDAGVLVRSGFRFGTHLRGYAGDIDATHADWIVHCYRPDDQLGAAELSRAVRLAHGVRKQMLIATASNPVQFTALSWFRP